MALTAEEQRHLDFLAQERRREASDRARRAALAGDPAARQALEEDWAPLRGRRTRAAD